MEYRELIAKYEARCAKLALFVREAVARDLITVEQRAKDLIAGVEADIVKYRELLGDAVLTGKRDPEIKESDDGQT